jgi:tetratricopeptide (TPR) repeat protein
MESDSPSPSDHAREKGDDLYKAGKLKEGTLIPKKLSLRFSGLWRYPAIASYQRAAELDPDNAAPHSNLSAAYFELREYSLAVSACDAAAERLIDGEDNAQLKQRLASRKMKACIHALQFSKAVEAISRLSKTRELQQLDQCISDISAISSL